MVCSCCVEQAATSWLPALLLPLLALFASLWSPACPTPVYSERPWLPRFINGTLAAIRMGMDEDSFLLSVHEQYGGVVYLPWPLCQFLVTDKQLVETVYSTSSKSLAFTPIRSEMYGTVFGGSKAALQSGALEARVYPAHGKGMSKLHLTAPLERFVSSVQASLDRLSAQLDAAQGGSTELDLNEWVTETMFAAATRAMFGTELFSFPGALLSPAELRSAFHDMDDAFPLFASGLVWPSLQRFVPPMRKGDKGRRALVNHLQGWVEAGFPGLEEGVCRTMAEIVLEEGLGSEEAGVSVSGTLWALQANAPFAALFHLLYLTQSPLLPAVVSEITSYLSSFPSTAEALSFNAISSSDALPLLTSTMYETLRLSSSSFSIRVVQAAEAGGHDLPSPSDPGASHLLPAGSRVVCATRVGHLLGEKEGAKWDGERYLSEEGRRRAAKEVRAFGGGISVCEGRSLAIAELKAFAVLVLTSLTIAPPAAESFGPGCSRELLYKDGSKGTAPKLKDGRVGMGIHQLVGEARVKVRRREGVSGH